MVLVPNNAQGKFRDSKYRDGTGSDIITDCDLLWNEMTAGNGHGPTDIAGIYRGDPSLSDFVSCDDTNGCQVTSTNCFSTWDSQNGRPTGKTASIPNGEYLACAFIDSPWVNGTKPQGAPPFPANFVGIISNARPTQFEQVMLTNPTTAPIAFNNWVDYLP